MNRPSVRGLPAGRASDAYQLNEDSSALEPVSGKVIEDWRFHGDSISSPGALRLMMGQAVQDHLSPSKPHQRIGDNGIINGAVKLEHFTSPDSLKSSVLSTSGQSRNRRGYAVSLGTSMLLCFVSVFAFIGLLGTRNPGYNLRLVPTLGIYRSYHRLQAEVVVDPFKGGIFGQGTVRMKELPACERLEDDSVPCYNSPGNLGSGHVAGEGDDRHCEVHKSRKQCLIQPPDDYKIPLRWPASGDGVWHGNMKFTEQFGLSGRRMASLKLGGDAAAILNLGVPDLDGLENHVQQITKAMGANDASQSGLRTVLDINCGLSRLVDHHRFLEKSSILCLAPYEVNGSQVQFALERGFPAMIGSVINSQLPFPSSSFDMIHCFDCDFDWTWKEGLLLLELDRLLKPGGFFIWTYQAALSVDPLMKMHEQDWQTNKELASLICWSALSEADQTVVWKKTANQSCYSSRGFEARPKLCDRLVDANSAWYPPLRPCIATPTVDKATHLQQQQQHRMSSGFSTEELADDSHVWSATVKSYWSLLSPLIFSDHPKRPGEEDPLPPSNIVRNVMDMNAMHGTLNAALLEAGKSVWVMNVVPRSGPDTLSIIYKRGLVGVQHDWCEAFPTYPRTYDLLHGIGLLSQEAARPNGCGLSNLFLEMDRILRPEGWVILRDKVELIEDARIAAGQMRWESRVIEVEGLEDQQLLVCQKTFWKSQSSKALL